MSWWVDKKTHQMESQLHVFPAPDDIRRWEKEEQKLTFLRIGSVILWLGALLQAVLAIRAGFLYLAPAISFAVVGWYVWRTPKGSRWRELL